MSVIRELIDVLTALLVVVVMAAVAVGVPVGLLYAVVRIVRYAWTGT